MTTQKIPVARPYLNGREAKYTSEAVLAGELSGNFGKFISQFENNFANYCGAKYGVSMNNGTTALHAAIAALGIGPGDEVIVQTLTNMATFFSVCYTGAVPVAIDVEPDTYNLNPALLESKITKKTKAIIVVHLYGHPVDMDAVNLIAKKYNLFVIEDAAQAHGAKYKGRLCGSLGDVACFSFYANKIITTGEGGMVITNNKELSDKVNSIHSLCYGQGDNKFMHEAIGFNYRMSNVIAAIGCAQLETISDVIRMKKALVKNYESGLQGIEGLRLPIQKDYAESVYWMYHVVLEGKLHGKRKEIMSKLKELGIETRESFVPFNKQKIFIAKGWVKEGDCPVANDIGENGFYLPSGPVFLANEQERVIETIKNICK